MDLGVQSGLLAAIVSVAVAVSVILRGRKLLVNTLFVVFCANLFVHFFATFFHHYSGHSFWVEVDLIGSAFLPVSAQLFFAYFLWLEPVLPRPFLRTSYVLTVAMVAFLITPWSHYTVSYVLVTVYVFVSLYLCAFFVFARYREISSKRDRISLRYLLVALLSAATFSLLAILPFTFDFLQTWGNFISILFLYFVSESLLSYRLLDLQELLGRGLVLTAVAIVLAAVFGILVLFAGGFPEVSLFQTFVASFIILILFEPLRDKLVGSTSRLFFRERLELRRVLEKVRREIANILDVDRMATVILDTLYDNPPTANTSLYLLEEGGASYRLIGHRGVPPPDRIDVAAHRPFFDQIKKTPTVLLRETFERHLVDQDVISEPTGDIKHARAVLETMSTLHTGICIPFIGKSEVLGLLNLLDESSTESFSTEEIARMMAIGEQAGINIENSMMVEKIRERDRLAVLGEMSAGLAHEIRNPLGAIKGAAQYLDPTSVGEDAAEFLKIIIEETDRLNQVVNQFLDYARPYQIQRMPTDVNEVVTHCLRVVQAGLEGKRIQCKTELQADLPSVGSNSQLLTQVFLNLMTNAVDAMPDGGTLTVRTNYRLSSPVLRLRGAAERIGRIEIEIHDTGRGIPPESLQHIFVPFFTTKERGTGLGLAISQRIVEQHGGEILVRSLFGDGSTFTVLLPCATESGKAPSASANNAQPTAEQLSEPPDLLFPGQHVRE
jgi:Signal transduction histidine kinase, nitrogen specific